jgi:arylsulfatase A-like enzyme
MAGRPNIVVLVADDWGFSDLGAFGGEIATPHLDALAKRGLRFSNFHVAASCSPTRSMLLTGVDNHRNGVGNLREAMPTQHLGKPGYQGSLSANVVTVASLLQDSGYRTYIAGKWNVGSEPQNLPNRRGFDKSIVQGDTGSDNWEPAKQYLPHLPQVYWFEDGKPATMPKEFYSSAYFVDRTIAFMESDPRQQQPFFAYVGFQANHVPVQAPKELIEKYKGRYREGWTVLRETRLARAIELGVVPPGTRLTTMSTTADWKSLGEKDRLHMERQMEVYAAMAESMDAHVGRLVEHLKKSGQYDNTVFVFLSDNGPEGSDYHEAQPWLYFHYTQDTATLGAKGSYGIPGPGWASASASPLNTYKFWSGEGGIRTPMLIAGPPVRQPNRIEHALTHVTDITPTLLDLAQVKAPGPSYRGVAVEPLTGMSLLPLLQGSASAVRTPDQPLGYELSGNAALFKGTLKLVRNMPPLGDGLWHLYDLRQDPGETLDLSARLPQEFSAMQVDYAAYEKANQVLEMPSDYSPQNQVFINSIWRYWVPVFGQQALGVVLALAALLLWWRLRRRRK